MIENRSVLKIQVASTHTHITADFLLGRDLLPALVRQYKKRLAGLGANQQNHPESRAQRAAFEVSADFRSNGFRTSLLIILVLLVLLIFLVLLLCLLVERALRASEEL